MDQHAVSGDVLNYYAQRLFERNMLEKALSLLDVAEKIFSGYFCGIHFQGIFLLHLFKELFVNINHTALCIQKPR